MITTKYFSYRQITNFTGVYLIWHTIWCILLVTILFYFFKWKWITIPWLPVTLIGTAEAFYVGFKNNQAYDRLWEAREIWGGIVNSSRSFTSMLYAFNSINENSILIAWLYSLRAQAQLLIPTEWEYLGISNRSATVNRKRNRSIKLVFYDYERTFIFLRKNICLKKIEV